MEFKNVSDIQIAEKMLKFPLLGENLENKWNLTLKREFQMTDDSYLFKTSDGGGRLPLYEGKMIHQFTHQFGEARYWIDEKEGREAVLKRDSDKKQTLDYQTFRLILRRIARDTDERSLIAKQVGRSDATF